MEILDGAKFDIILAVNACARLQLDAASLSGVRDILAPGGAFVAAEPEPNALWDVVFGENLEWWLASPPGAEASPLRPGGEWRAELAAAGFQIG